MKHCGYHTSGLLKYPYFWQERKDVTWEDLLSKVEHAATLTRKDLMHALGLKLGCKKLDDWYGVSVASVRENGGSELLDRYYGGVLYRALQNLYPEHDWKPWLFNQSVPKGHWDSLENQKCFVDWFYKETGMKGMEEWYGPVALNFAEKGGGGMLHRYSGSMPRLLQTVYPEHSWSFNKFSTKYFSWLSERDQRKVTKTDRGHWDNKENWRELVEWVAKEMNIKTHSEWYRVASQQIQRIAPTSLFRKHGFFQVLSHVYPSHTWERGRLEGHRPIKAAQRVMAIRTQELFPEAELKEEFAHPEIRYLSGQKATFDVFLLREKLALEYQGEQHFKDVYVLGSRWRHRERDEQKRELCVTHGES